MSGHGEQLIVVRGVQVGNPAHEQPGGDPVGFAPGGDREAGAVAGRRRDHLLVGERGVRVLHVGRSMPQPVGDDRNGTCPAS
ncbi:MAG: hypothetical protein QOD91_2127 [Frankiales bacterium]|nr:hypothetical protein [Frankiales bacterium]